MILSLCCPVCFRLRQVDVDGAPAELRFQAEAWVRPKSHDELVGMREEAIIEYCLHTQDRLVDTKLALLLMTRKVRSPRS
jgi:hypothetical protein